MASPRSDARVEMSSNQEEDEFWVDFGKAMVSNTLNVVDNRAQFMITTCASLLVADFAIVRFTLETSSIAVSPQFLLALSALSFMVSLYPKRYRLNPWLPDETRTTFLTILNRKWTLHLIGFGLFFIALIAIAITSLPFIT